MIFINSGASREANRNAARSATSARNQQQRRRPTNSANQQHAANQRTPSLPHSIRISLTDLKNSEIDKLVQERLSVPYIIVHCLVLIFCSICLIALQITGLVISYRTNYSASGIWYRLTSHLNQLKVHNFFLVRVGSYYLVTAGITCLLGI